jgi:hypothetical protein
LTDGTNAFLKILLAENAFVSDLSLINILSPGEPPGVYLLFPPRTPVL